MNKMLVAVFKNEELQTDYTERTKKLAGGKLISWERSRTLIKLKLRPSHDTGILGLEQLVAGAFNKLQALQIIH